jgi:hypothetical protein
LIYPSDNTVEIDQSQPFRWTPIANAEAYYLYVGSSPGATDLINSYETQATTLLTSRVAAPFPDGVTLYVRLWTKVGGLWRYRDSTFTASPMAPKFLYPTDGALAVDPAVPFRWKPPANAINYELRVGTSPGGSDVFQSGILTTTSVLVTGLPPTGTLYARAVSKVNTSWTFTDIAFTLQPSVAASGIVVPANDEIDFDTVRAFEWTPVPLARAYRLTIGTAAGGNNLHDSGEIQVTRRFVPNLLIGTLYGRVETKIDGQWFSNDFTFSVRANTVSTSIQIDSALWATHFVRSMAPSEGHHPNRPYSWTKLAERRFLVYCSDYTATLFDVWSQMNGHLPISRLDVTLNPNSFDAHTLAELFNPETQTWMLMDPTFDLAVKRTADNGWATAEEVSAATRSQQWGNISYVFLGPLADYHVRGYIIDYPLLFVNVHHAGELAIKGEGGPVLPYMAETSMPVSGSPQAYAIGCSGTQTAVLRIDGVEQTVDCSGVDGLSSVFRASSISATALTAPSVKVYSPQRYVF